MRSHKFVFTLAAAGMLGGTACDGGLWPGRDKPKDEAPSTGCSQGDCGPGADDFFAEGKVAELRITFSDTEIQQAAMAARRDGLIDEANPDWLDLLWAQWGVCTDFQYLRATMEYRSPDHRGDVKLPNVGVRLRGTIGRGVFPLQGFHVHLEKLLPATTEGTPMRHLAGMKKLNVLSNERDSSLMVQCLAYDMMRDFGVPASRCNHLSVYINDQYYGLMQNVEDPDTSAYLTQHFDDARGSHYSASGGCLYKDSFADLAYLGPSFADYATPPKYRVLHTKDGDPTAPNRDLVPMLRCGDVTTTPDQEAFRSCIQEWLDVPEWLKVIAGESLMPTLESLVGSLRNYYLYFVPDATAPHGGRFQIYSWDYDTAFQHQPVFPITGDPFSSVTQWFFPASRAKLVLRLTSVFKTEYCQTMRDFLTSVYKPERIDALADIVEPIVMDATLRSSSWPIAFAGATAPAGPLTTSLWRDEIARTRDFIATNRTQMLGLVATLCQ